MKLSYFRVRQSLVWFYNLCLSINEYVSQFWAKHYTYVTYEVELNVLIPRPGELLGTFWGGRGRDLQSIGINNVIYEQVHASCSNIYKRQNQVHNEWNTGDFPVKN